MNWERQRTYDFDAGQEKKAIDSAIEFLKEKIDPKIIAKCEKLPLEKVLELQEQLAVKA